MTSTEVGLASRVRGRATPKASDPHGVARACGLISGAAGLLTTVAVSGGVPDPRAMINLARTDPLAPYVRASDAHFPLVTAAQHYDGVYYFAIARDPLALGRAHTLIDQAAYRYGHPLHGWFGALLSLGQPRLIPAALFALSLLGLGMAGFFASRLADTLGGRPWLGLLVAGSPGLLYSATVSTTEAVGAALVLASLFAWHRQRIGQAGLLLTLACLDKEQYVMLPVGLALWTIIMHRRFGSRGADTGKRIVTLALTVVPLAGWYVYIAVRLHRWPFQYQGGNLTWPINGWLNTVRHAHELVRGSFDESQLGSLTVPVLIAIAVVLLAAAVRAVRLRSSPVHFPLALLVVITACQDYKTLLYPHELIRTPAIVLLLAMLVLLTPDSREQS